jgi:hypothetical protein
MRITPQFSEDFSEELHGADVSLARDRLRLSPQSLFDRTIRLSRLIFALSAGEN